MSPATRTSTRPVAYTAFLRMSLVFPILGLAPSVDAQGTITHGANTRYDIGVVPATHTAATGTMNFTGNSPVIADTVYQAWFYYRIDNDTRELTLNSSMPGFQQSSSATRRRWISPSSVSVYLQAFFLDPGAAGGMAHTDGLEWILGEN